MDHDEAMNYLKQMHGEEASQTSEPTEAPDVADTTGASETTQEQETPVPESEAKEDREPSETEVNETAADKQQPKKKPTKQEKIDHAFQRQNKRHKAEIAERDKRIAELEEKVKKYSVSLLLKNLNLLISTTSVNIQKITHTMTSILMLYWH